ncbi:MAG: response regulator [Acidobacteria bacterium]|nr:response regulator [Acidobacteriota bacterium]
MGDAGNTVVVVDDEEGVRNYLNEVLTLEGYDCKCFPESSAALDYMGETAEPPALVLTDIRMPGLDGLELLKRVRSLSPSMPVILISGYYESNMALEAVRAGASDYLFKPAQPAEVISIVARHLRSNGEPDRAAVQVALARFLAQYKNRGQLDLLSESQPDPAMELFRSLVWKRYETMQHSMRVSAYATLLGRAYGLTSGPLWNLRLGALLHDVGKIAVPRNVLMKPGPLNEEEWKVMRTHPLIGFQLLAAFPGMREVAEVVYAHHEHYDGSGYPRGLCGEEIPVGARLFSIADAVDAITCRRPYRQAQTFEQAFEILRQCRGTQFDPAQVDLFLTLPTAKLAAIHQQLRDEE